MKLDYKTLITVSVLISIFSLASLYVFSRINLWLSFGLGWKFYLLGALLGGCSFIFIIWHPFHSKIIYQTASYWFGFVFFAFVVFVAGDLAVKLMPLNYNHLALTTLIIALLISGYSVSNHLWGRKVESIALHSPKIRSPLRVVLIADTHISGFHSSEYLSGIVNEINAQSPDIVCISGDFADGRTKLSAIEPINDINAPVYVVMGNHEVWNNHNGEIQKLLNKTKAKTLHQSEEKGVQLIGVHFSDGRNGLEEGLKDIRIDPKAYNILLYHEPKDVEVAQKAGIDLMLSGHTHGGQIFPWDLVTKLAYKYIKGLYTLNGMHLYVSRGTGVWGPPMRFGSTNEITVIDLGPAQI